MLDGDINTIHKSTEALLEASREVCIEVNTRKTMYIFVSCHQNVGQNCNLLIADKSLEKKLHSGRN
jgi:hypothetical protein